MSPECCCDAHEASQIPIDSSPVVTRNHIIDNPLAAQISLRACPVVTGLSLCAKRTLTLLGRAPHAKIVCLGGAPAELLKNLFVHMPLNRAMNTVAPLERTHVAT